MAALAFWMCLVLIYLVYDGYLRILQIACRLQTEKFLAPNSLPEPPKISVVVLAYNEQDTIVQKIENALQCQYPSDRFELLVVSDGSTDDTDNLVRQYPDSRVRLFRPPHREGISDSQNQAVEQVRGDIVVFSDAETVFDTDFLVQIAKAFADPTVGCVTGRLFMKLKSGQGISESQGFYWSYELKLRSLESRLGVLAVGSGACLAIRREIYHPLKPEHGGDCVIPLEAVRQGWKVVQAEQALAYDQMHHELRREFRARVRMTTRNWLGTWAYPELINPWSRPGYAGVLWCHKLLRWLSPFFLLAATGISIGLALRAEFFLFASLGFTGFYLLGLLGWLAETRGKKVPLASTIFSFLLAQAGFLLGVIIAISGRYKLDYRSEQKEG